MRRVLEPFVFVTLALGLHLAMFPGESTDAGADAAGAEGDQLLSIQASSASIEAMVEDWSRPPSIQEPQQIDVEAPQDTPSEDLPVPATPQDFAFEAPSVGGLAVPTTPEKVEVEFAPMQSMPESLAEVTAEAPDLSQAPETQNPEVSPTPDTPVSPSQPTPTVAAPDSPTAPAPPQSALAPPPPEPVAETDELASSARPQRRPNPPPQRAQPARTTPQKAAQAPSRNSTAQAGQTAAGQGGGASAGATATATTATLNPAKEASLVAQWGGRVRSQIERRKRYPSSARGTDGTTRLAVTISRSGQLLGARVTKSSGSKALDAAALAAVKATRRYAKAPKELRHQQITFTLAVSFQG